MRLWLARQPAFSASRAALAGGLEQQAGTQAGHLLQHLAEDSLGGEQVVYLGADALGGRYSCSHRVWILLR